MTPTRYISSEESIAPSRSPERTSVKSAFEIPADVPAGRQLAYAAPGAAETLKGFPPTCLFIGDVDPLRDEGLAFGQRLVADGAPTTHAGSTVISTEQLPDDVVSTTIHGAKVEVDVFDDDEIEKAIEEIRGAIEKSSQLLK